MAYSLSNNRTKNYWNKTTTVKIIVRGWVVHYFLQHHIDSINVNQHAKYLGQSSKV